MPTYTNQDLATIGMSEDQLRRWREAHPAPSATDITEQNNWLNQQRQPSPINYGDLYQNAMQAEGKRLQAEDAAKTAALIKQANAQTALTEMQTAAGKGLVTPAMLMEHGTKLYGELLKNNTIYQAETDPDKKGKIEAATWNTVNSILGKFNPNQIVPPPGTKGQQEIAKQPSYSGPPVASGVGSAERPTTTGAEALKKSFGTPTNQPATQWTDDQSSVLGDWYQRVVNRRVKELDKLDAELKSLGVNAERNKTGGRGLVR